MDLQRINKDLKNSLDHSTRSLELNTDDFLNNPELIQKERKDFALNKPIPIPTTIMVSDIEIVSSNDKEKIRLHIYQSKTFNPERVILYFHGGGYVFGIPEQVDHQMFLLTDKLNATIISVDYRLSPQFRYPTAIEDGMDAFEWLIHHGNAALGINSEKISIYGGSAGAHLAGKVTQLAIEKGYHQINHQFLLYPLIHFRLDSKSMNDLKDAPLWNKEYAEIAKLHFLGKENLENNPTIADLDVFENLEKLPKTTLVACELDPLRDEAIAYARQLYDSDVPTELWVVPGAVHVFDVFPSTLQKEYEQFLIKRLQSGFDS